MRVLPLLILTSLAPALSAQAKLPLVLAAKFLKIFCTAEGGSGAVACNEAEMKAELGRAGAKVDAGADFAWATTAGEVQTFAKQGKIVVVDDLELIKAGASIALVVDAGKPSVLISAAGRSHAKVPATVKKIAKPV